MAYIAYGRHLQNLDNNTSQVETNKTASNMIRSAIQVDDISFLENDADPECFYSVYGDRLFQPIHNSGIHSYAGQKIGSGESGSGGIPAISGLHIETTDNRGVGLFSSFTGTIQDLLVTGPRVLGDGSNVGVLVGASSGKTQISHVQVFLSTLLGDLDRAGTAGEVAKVKPWLQGRNAGGLIGTAGSNGELTITGSVGMLPQNPQALFVKSSVRADLLEILPKSERKSERLAQVVSLCKLAELLDADMLVILTSVDKVCLSFGKDEETKLDTLTVSEAKQFLADGEFEAGTMAPKIEAAIDFIGESAIRSVLITKLNKDSNEISGGMGTLIKK